jgi:hypothetical protein
MAKTATHEEETGETRQSPPTCLWTNDDNEGDDDDDGSGEAKHGVEASRHKRRKESVSYEDDEDDESTDGQAAPMRDEAQGGRCVSDDPAGNHRNDS